MRLDNKALTTTLLALFFGWLLSFPLFGPGLGWLALRGVAPEAGAWAFTLAHGLGLVGLGLAWPLLPARPHLLLAAVAACLLLSLLVVAWPPAWPLAAALLGLAAAVVVLAWARGFVTAFAPQQRGRAFAAIVVLANAALYLANFGAGSLAADAAMALALVCLGLAALPAARMRAVAHPAAGAGPSAPRSLPVPLGFALFIFAFYLTGGLLYQVALPRLAEFPAIGSLIGVLPYMAAAAAAGWLADRFGRRPLAFIGVAMLGLAFTFFPLSASPAGATLSHLLMQAGYGFGDIFLWVVLADMALPGQATRSFGIGLGLNLSAIYCGGLLSGSLGSDAWNRLGVAFLFLAILALFSLRETLAPDQPAPAAPPGPPAKPPAEWNLTPREQDIFNLLAKGLSNLQIREQLFISAGTMKTHLRHIYQKAGVNSRRELMQLIPPAGPGQENG